MRVWMLSGLVAFTFGCNAQLEDNQAANDHAATHGSHGEKILATNDSQWSHRDKTAPDGTVEFAAHIPEPGIYNAWGQFQRGGSVVTVPFVLKHHGGKLH